MMRSVALLLLVAVGQTPMLAAQEQIDRDVVVTLLMFDHSQKMECVWMIGRSLEYLAIALFGGG